MCAAVMGAGCSAFRLGPLSLGELLKTLAVAREKTGAGARRGKAGRLSGTLGVHMSDEDVRGISIV
jgi:hypothetical protein